ncbi:virulence factor BrkB family protein [Zobellella maritima]|uniref:virulence factor BrkB family protein n=1 Tax=Zobellella maritima TaxID=2059725 RepID=UPI000E301FEE|nr:virulence factor BrkB family protein [Zobellella maritima]
MTKVIVPIGDRLHFIREHGAGFGRFLLKRINQDRLTVTAGYLAYITLLSLVPLVSVVFAMMSAFPMFAELRDTLQDFVFANFVPTAGEVVKQHIEGFVDNASGMTAIGVAALAVTAMLLISAIEQNFNHIWRVTHKRRWSVAFSTYWMILTLGPILAGASLAVSSYVVSLRIFQAESFLGIGAVLLSLLPFILSCLMFVVFYMVVPNTRVRFGHAICGALVAALLFELAKRAFALYITQFPSYQLIYGALATIPILFVWVYVSWLVALLGAELTASLGDYERSHGLSFRKNEEQSAKDGS